VSLRSIAAAVSVTRNRLCRAQCYAAPRRLIAKSPRSRCALVRRNEDARSRPARSVPGAGAQPALGNLGGDPDWNAAIFAVAARSDADDGAVSLRLPMPSWLTFPDADAKQLLTTQDFVDIYAYLVSETQ
jgi:hypothetical protein